MLAAVEVQSLNHWEVPSCTLKMAGCMVCMYVCMVCEFYLNEGVKRLGDVIPPSLFFFSKTILATLGPLPFHVNLCLLFNCSIVSDSL